MNYSMALFEVLSHLPIDKAQYASLTELEVTSLEIDSRKVTEGALFFAYPGVYSDGRDYLLSAQQAGASAVVYEAGVDLPVELIIPAFSVNGLQELVGKVANQFYQEPSSELQVFGVTGTNGKTTCCYLLTQALEKLGLSAAMIGTIGVGKLSALDSLDHTTPDPISVHRLLAMFRDQGVTQVCMEVSSHALDQGRVNGVEFFCSLFTNLTHDHLDYHGDMTSYAIAKRRLFSAFHSELVITNASDEFGAGLIDVANAEFIVSYGIGGDVFADEVTLTSEGMRLFIEGNGVDFEVATPLIGRINVANIEMLVATLLGLSVSVQDIVNILSELKPAPGRMDLFTAQAMPNVVVDYAHTPDALEKALQSVKEHCDGELWCVAVSSKYADHVVITNDNPRTEVPADIASDIAAGASEKPQILLDRKQAITLAVQQAKHNDWVLVAGKGHEATQQIGDEFHCFSDRDLVLKLISNNCAGEIQ